MDEIPQVSEQFDVPATGTAQSQRLLFEFLDSESRDLAFAVWR